MTCKIPKNVVIHGDCLQELRSIPDKSVDLVLADPPYGTTACKWDSVIPLDEMWRELHRVGKPKSPFVFMCSQPFTTTLASSNIRNFKYMWVWEKNFSTNFFHAKRQPLRKHEDICVFYCKPGKYYPQKTEGHKPTQSAKGSSKGKLWYGENTRNYEGGETSRYPTSVIKFNAVDPKQRKHSTEKPVPLMEYLIKTYTNEGDLVLDFCAGSGTTGVACQNTNRNYILIEKEQEYIDIIHKRLEENKENK